LRQLLSTAGRTNDFRKLRTMLRIVATDLDSGSEVRFGEAGLDHVPISEAIRASTALPGLYTPVRLGGHSYVDGALLRTVHASLVLDRGAGLVISVNVFRYKERRVLANHAYQQTRRDLLAHAEALTPGKAWDSPAPRPPERCGPRFRYRGLPAHRHSRDHRPGRHARAIVRVDPPSG
jgi:predicted acylesterase/phospholipase RssA